MMERTVGGGFLRGSDGDVPVMFHRSADVTFKLPDRVESIER
jgi:hypothetical protein